MKSLFPETMPSHERRERLESMADSIEEGKYFRALTDEEIQEKKDVLTENTIKLSDITDEKKAAMAAFKAEEKPLKENSKELMKLVKTRQEEVDGILYHISDHDEGMMNTYDEAGFLINSRRLRPSEKQSTIFNIQKAQ